MLCYDDFGIRVHSMCVRLGSMGSAQKNPCACRVCTYIHKPVDIVSDIYLARIFDGFRKLDMVHTYLHCLE